MVESELNVDNDWLEAELNVDLLDDEEESVDWLLDVETELRVDND
jgi:hypothetical protein